MGLLWTLGIIGGEEAKDVAAVARSVQRSIRQLLDSWQRSGYLGGLQYQMLPDKEGFGVRIVSGGRQ